MRTPNRLELELQLLVRHQKQRETAQPAMDTTIITPFTKLLMDPRILFKRIESSMSEAAKKRAISLPDGLRERRGHGGFHHYRHHLSIT